LATAVLLLAGGVWLGHTLQAAWRESVRREMYLPDLERAAKKTLNDGRLLALLGARLMEAHEHRAASDVLRRALAAGEQEQVVWQGLAGAQAAAGENARAIAALQLGLREHPDSQSLRAALERAQTQGSASSAPGELAMAICPHGPQPLSKAYTKGSFFNGFHETWGRRHPETSGFATRQRWAAKRPDDAQAQRLWGLALVRNRREVEAGLVLRRAVELAPDSPAARLALGDFYAGSDLTAKAGLEYLACLKRRPNWLPALLGLGRVSLRENLEYGVTCYERAVKADPRNVEAWIGLGRTRYQMDQNYAASAQAFAEAGRLAPERTDFFAGYASALRDANRESEAEAVLRRRLARVPNDAECQYLLAGVLAEFRPTEERLAEAEARGREALRLSPNTAIGQAQLGKLLLERGNVHEAVPLLETAVTRRPRDVSTRNVLARAYARMGKRAQAERVFGEARRLFTADQRISVLENKRKGNLLDVNVHAQLARLYDQTGQRERAVQARDMERRLRADPKQVARELATLRTAIKAALPGGV
jgi:predicted Zn-dependent protease